MLLVFIAITIATVTTALCPAAAPLRPAAAPLRPAPASCTKDRARIVAQAQLPYPWQQLVDQNGQVYYANAQTGVTLWDPPTADYLPQGPNMGPQVIWRLAKLAGVTRLWQPEGARVVRRDGFDLPYVLRNGDERVLSRWNMVSQKVTVSRMQCVVRVLPDGTPTLSSIGRGPTLCRAGNGAPWLTLRKDETQVLVNGAHVSLDCNNPEGATFVCEVDSTQQQSGYETSLPYPWQAMVGQSGEVFYSNAQTGVTQWDPP